MRQETVLPGQHQNTQSAVKFIIQTELWRVAKVQINPDSQNKQNLFFFCYLFV